MTSTKNNLKTQRSGERRTLHRLFSTKSGKVPKPASARRTMKAASLNKSVSLQASLTTVPSNNEAASNALNNAVDRREHPDLMDKFYKAVQSVKGSRELSSELSARLTNDLVAAKSMEKTDSSSGASQGDSVSTPASNGSGLSSSSSDLIKSTSQNFTRTENNAVTDKTDTAFLWRSRRTSCFTGSVSSIDMKRDSQAISKLERSPTDDILIMLDEQRAYYNTVIKTVKSEMRGTQKQIGLLRRQLEGVKKSSPQKKALMATVDELDHLRSLANKMQSKLKCLQYTRDSLRRKVYSDKAAQQALESLDVVEAYTGGEQRQRDFELFTKLSYAGLLKEHHQ
eukprot:g6082.t1